MDTILAMLVAWALIVSAVIGALWVRLRHAEEDAEQGWAALGATLDEIKAHLERLYRRTNVLPDGGVVEDER